MPEQEGKKVEGQEAVTQQTTQEGKVFTQKDLESLWGQRLTKERQSFKAKQTEIADEAVKAWREENGITDDILEKLSKVEQTVIEARKIKTESTKLSNEHQKTQEKLNKIQSKLFDALTRDAVFTVASGKTVSPKHLWLDIKSRMKIDEDTLKVYLVDENGERDDTLTLDTLVGKTLEENPWLAMPTGLPGSGNQGSFYSRGGNNTKPTLERRPGDEVDFLKAKLEPFMKT